MKSLLLRDDNNVQAMRELRERLASNSTIVDFEEQILLPSIRATTRMWEQDNKIVGFAFVDDYNNLWFETEAGFASLDELEAEIVGWGVTCMIRRNTELRMENTLDCTCDAGDSHRLRILKKHGFVPGQVRSLQYSRPLNKQIPAYPLPAGFSIRCARGKNEVEGLVALHRAAFGTNHLTVEYRLAMMNAPGYRADLDLVAVTPEDELAAFCVCGLEEHDQTIGYTDPIGTHPSYRRIGLAQALVAAGLTALKNAGARTARLGTSSDNIAMKKLAIQSGFVCVSEKLWFSKAIS